jgi:hypothetical protein
MIYLLTRKDRSGYDEYDAKVVRSHSEASARAIANETVGDEGEIWTDPTKVDCRKVPPVGEDGVILASFIAG